MHFNLYSSLEDDATSGVFWISLDDFLEYFSSITICKTDKNLHETRLKIKYQRKNRLIGHRLIVRKTCEINMSFFDEQSCECSTTETSKRNYFVLKLNEKTTKKPIQMVKHYIEKNHESLYESGEYLILAFNSNFWLTSSSSNHETLNLVVHSSREIQIEEHEYDEEFLAQALIQLTMHKGLDYEFDYKCLKGYILYNDLCLSSIILVIENRCSDYKLKVKTNCFSNIKSIRLPYNRSTVDIIPPKHRQIVQILIAEDYISNSVSYYFKDEYEWVSLDAEATNRNLTDRVFTPQPI